MFDERELATAFAQVAALARVDVTIGDVQIETTPAPHKRPARLPAERQAVYAFFLGGQCLKVGKAGAKSGARFASHHYGLNVPSTLARSLLGQREQVATLLSVEAAVVVRALDELSVGAWIETNTTRMNVLLLAPRRRPDSRFRPLSGPEVGRSA